MTEETPRKDDGNAAGEHDSYPTLAEVCSRILDETELTERRVERVELHLFASGEATYRVWEPRAEDPEGGYLPTV